MTSQSYFVSYFGSFQSNFVKLCLALESYFFTLESYFLVLESCVFNFGKLLINFGKLLFHFGKLLFKLAGMLGSYFCNVARLLQIYVCAWQKQSTCMRDPRTCRIRACHPHFPFVLVSGGHYRQFCWTFFGC